MTTPLSGDHQLMLNQVDGFNRGKREMGRKGGDLSLSLSRVAFVAKNEQDKREKLEMAYEYYSRFDNVFTGPGKVNHGMIDILPRKQSMEELNESLLICSVEEMIEKLLPYKEIGIDRLILNMNFGASHEDTMTSIEEFSDKVIPHFS